MSFSRNNTAKKDDKPANNDNSNGSAKKDYILADALKEIFMVNSKGPSALAGLAIALAGDDLKYPVGEQLSRIADAFESIADSLEVIADAMDDEAG